MIIYYLYKYVCGVVPVVSKYFFTKKENAESRINWLKENKNQDWFIGIMKQDSFETIDKNEYYDWNIPDDLGDQI